MKMDSLSPYVLTVGTLVALIIIYFKQLLQFWKRRNIPYLEPTFPFGNLGNTLLNKKPLALHFKDFHDKLKSIGAKFGGAYLYCSPVLVITDPEIIRDVLLKDFAHFHERGFYNSESFQPESANLFTTDGEKWRKLRTKFTPTFTTSKMKSMFNLMLNAEKELEKYIRSHATSKKSLNINKAIGYLSSDVIGSCIFGIECNSFEDLTFQNVLQEGMKGSTSFIKLSFCNAMPKLAHLLRVPLVPWKEVRFINKSIDDTIKYRLKNNVTRKDFLQLLIEMLRDKVIDIDEVNAQCILFFLAGYESSANTMVFLMFELASNPDIQEKLREEIQEAFPEDAEMTYEGVMNLKYLEMAMCEALRKYAPLAILNRNCMKDFTLPKSNVTIEKGTKIVVSVSGLHSDPDYFPDPDKFDPERFSEENKKKIVPYTYMPFGEGPRYCIGDRFAKQEIKLTIASLVRKFRFTLSSENKAAIPLKFLPSGLFIAPGEDILLEVEEA